MKPRGHSAYDDTPEVTTIWRGVTRLLGWGVVLAIIGVLLAFFKPQNDRLTNWDARLEELKKEKNGLQETHQALKSKLDWIRRDPAYLEVQARDRLDLAREGETIVRFEDGK